MITGGAGDIGFAVARRMVAEGAQVLLMDLNAERLAERRKNCPGAGIWCRFTLTPPWTRHDAGQSGGVVIESRSKQSTDGFFRGSI